MGEILCYFFFFFFFVLCGVGHFFFFFFENNNSSSNCFWKIWRPSEGPIKIISYCYWSPQRLGGLVGWLMCLLLAGTEAC